ncbi:MAG: hypothetical protein J6T44_09170 [Prevotella sp.]|nr:hypothetical protein [Prevotella sp.]
MDKTITIDGQIAVTLDRRGRVFNIQFMPDDEMAPVLDQSSITTGRLQQIRNGAFDYTANKSRIKANSDLIRKAAHGRLSGTRDNAFQLTLKCFASEAIDWQRAFVTETVDIMTDLMGPERMRSILKELIIKL